MDYFLLKQDLRCSNVPNLKNIFYKLDTRNINRLNAHKIDDVLIFQVNAEDNAQYPDVLDKQLFLISEKIGNIISKFDPEMIIKTVPLIDRKRNRQENYYLPIFEEVDALSEKTERGVNRTVIKKIVLDKEKILGKKIFKINEYNNQLVVVRLDVAESLLRRKVKGVDFIKLEVY